MKEGRTVTHEFVELMPETLDEGKVYISIPHSTALHKCFCGCGNEVVTPISPVGWTLSFDGKSISLDPSIGSWQLPCKSHYWIARNRVEWAPTWSGERIRRQQSSDRSLREEYFSGAAAPAAVDHAPRQSRRTIWDKLKLLLH
jgi:hypothetical protein